MTAHELLQLLGTIEALATSLNSATAVALKNLLETKHLYQRVAIPAEEAVRQVRDRFHPELNKSALPKEPMLFLAAQLRSPIKESDLAAASSTSSALMILKAIKIFCSRCEGREAFHPIFAADVGKTVPQHTPSAPMFQLFALSYQCQNCFGPSVGFLVRRDGFNLILEGRSPLEQIVVPAYIPKKEERFYRDAVIAMHAGKTLAALFYLRTFIEQFARRQTHSRGRLTGDDLMNAYIETLPKEHRDYMPSLGDWYGKLSEALHEAREDDELFELGNIEILRHFDIRRVFKMPEGGALISPTGS